MSSLTDAWARGFPQLARVLSPAMTGRAQDARAQLAEFGDGDAPLHRALALAALGDRAESLVELDGVGQVEWPDTLLIRYHPPTLTASIEDAQAYHAFIQRLDESWGVSAA